MAAAEEHTLMQVVTGPCTIAQVATAKSQSYANSLPRL